MNSIDKINITITPFKLIIKGIIIFILTIFDVVLVIAMFTTISGQDDSDYHTNGADRLSWLEDMYLKREYGRLYEELELYDMYDKKYDMYWEVIDAYNMYIDYQEYEYEDIEKAEYVKSELEDIYENTKYDRNKKHIKLMLDNIE